MIDKLKHKNTSNEPNGIRDVFEKLLRSSEEVEDFIEKIKPGYGTDPNAGGIRAAAELYRHEYGRMIYKLNKLTTSPRPDPKEIDRLYTELSSLLNLDPASTYGWTNAKPFGKASTELAGKGEGPGKNWLEDAKYNYDHPTVTNDKEAAKLKMARALTRLLDLPTGLATGFNTAVEDLQERRLNLYFNNNKLVSDIKALFGKPTFQAWVTEDEKMRRLANATKFTASVALNTAKAALASQANYEILQTAEGIKPPYDKISPPSKLDGSNTTQMTNLQSGLTSAEFTKLKWILT